MEYDEAIAVILRAMKRVEAEKGEYWYLPWMKLRKAFHHLCDLKYGVTD